MKALLTILRSKPDKAKRMPGNRSEVKSEDADKFARFIKSSNKRKLGRK